MCFVVHTALWCNLRPATAYIWILWVPHKPRFDNSTLAAWDCGRWLLGRLHHTDWRSKLLSKPKTYMSTNKSLQEMATAMNLEISAINEVVGRSLWPQHCLRAPRKQPTFDLITYWLLPSKIKVKHCWLTFHEKQRSMSVWVQTSLKCSRREWPFNNISFDISTQKRLIHVMGEYDSLLSRHVNFNVVLLGRDMHTTCLWRHIGLSTFHWKFYLIETEWKYHIYAECVGCADIHIGKVISSTKLIAGGLTQDFTPSHLVKSRFLPVKLLFWQTQKCTQTSARFPVLCHQAFGFMICKLKVPKRCQEFDWMHFESPFWSVKSHVLWSATSMGWWLLC